MKITLSSLLALNVLLNIWSLYLLHVANLTMDKSGIGDIELMREYESEAMVVLTLSIIVWSLILILAMFGKQLQSKFGVFCVSTPLITYAAGWVLLWFI